MLDMYARIDADPVGETKKLLREGDSFDSLHEDKAVRGLLRRIDELVRMVADATLQRDEAMAALVVVRNTFWGGGGPSQRDEAGAWVLQPSTEARITETLDALRTQIDAAWARAAPAKT